MSQGDRGKRVADALRARPGLLYDVLVDLALGPVVLGPWKRVGIVTAQHERHSVEGCYARVRPDEAAETPMWNWFVYGRQHGDPWGTALDKAHAMASADAKLREFGYLLADAAPIKLTLWEFVRDDEQVVCERKDEDGTVIIDICEGPEGQFWGRLGANEVVYPEEGTRFDDFDDCRAACDAKLRERGYEL